MFKLIKFLLKIGMVVLAVVGLMSVVTYFTPQQNAQNNENVNQNAEVSNETKYNVSMAQEIGTFDIESNTYRYAENVYIKNYNKGDGTVDFVKWLEQFKLHKNDFFVFDYSVYTAEIEKGVPSQRAILTSKVKPDFEQEFNEQFDDEYLDSLLQLFKDNAYKFPHYIKKVYEYLGKAAGKIIEILVETFEGVEPPAGAPQSDVQTA